LPKQCAKSYRTQIGNWQSTLFWRRQSITYATESRHVVPQFKIFTMQFELILSEEGASQCPCCGEGNMQERAAKQPTSCIEVTWKVNRDDSHRVGSCDDCVPIRDLNHTWRDVTLTLLRKQICGSINIDRW